MIFTHDNATVYTIARQFLVPVITHQTKTKERREILLRFNAGTYPIVATSRVLNEGVNVPEANVAIILSGSGSVREHVQRLGRILRKSGNKDALLYEVITRGTAEEFTSSRRRKHDAYDGDPGRLEGALNHARAADALVGRILVRSGITLVRPSHRVTLDLRSIEEKLHGVLAGLSRCAGRGQGRLEAEPRATAAHRDLLLCSPAIWFESGPPSSA